ncbi:MAG: TonB-dependent receptor, partial [Candidatus Kryptoniota bacterium]
MRDDASMAISTLLLLCAFLILPSFSGLLGQTKNYTLRGMVTDSATGERIPYATIRVRGTSIATYSNAEGYFVLPNILRAYNQILVSAVGYKEQIFEIKNPGSVVNVTLQLREEPTILSPVEVTGEYPGKMKPAAPSTTVLYARDIQKATGIFNNDIIQAITQLPGVVTVGGISSQYYVRGGAADQNLVTVDGIRMYNLFHAFGLFSFIDPLIVKVADMSTGGFQAQYGGRLSSILSMETKDGDRFNYEAAGSFDLLSSDVMLSGPVPLPMGRGHTSFIGFYRRSLYKNSLRRFFGRSLPFDFYDAFGKITSDFTSTGHVSLEVFSTADRISSEKETDSDYHWQDLGYSLSASYLFSDQYSFQFSVSTSMYTAEQLPRSLSYLHYELSKVTDPAFFGNLSYFASPDQQLDFGLLFNFPSYNFTFTNAYGNVLSMNENEVEPNFWVKYKRPFFRKFTVELGLRFDISRSFMALTGGTNGYTADPRLTITYDLSPASKFYIAAGRYHQRIISLTNEDDIYTPFELIVPISSDAYSALKDEEAYHYIIGGQIYPSNLMQIKLEGYYKDYTKLVTANRNKVDQNDPDFVMGTGAAFGIESSMQYDVGSFYTQLNYAFSKVTNTVDGFTFSPRYDRQHQINISIGLQPFQKLWLRAHWEFGSGLPYTPLAGFYSEL